MGKGSYSTTKPAGAKGPPEEIFRTDRMTGPVPTNDWWSSLVWEKFSSRHYPHPLSVNCEPGGFRVSYDGERIHSYEVAMVGTMSGEKNREITIGHAGVAEFPDARLDGFSDWFVSAKFADGKKSLRCTYGHGSPYVFVECQGGGVSLGFDKAPTTWEGGGLTTASGSHFGLFLPSGAKWKVDNPTRWTSDLGGKTYFTLALLPDNKPETLALFAKHAHAHIVDSQVAWKVAGSNVRTTFTVKTEAKEGAATGTLMALYPHQWKRTDAQLLPLTYRSVRGEMRLFEGETFATDSIFPGVLPALPLAVEGVKPDLEKIAAEDFITGDTYWGGKKLGTLATSVPIAEIAGEKELAEKLRSRLEAKLEDWFTASGPGDKAQFVYDAHWGTLIGYPASYGSDNDLNDHHFHYGYFLRGAAEIARRDPAWAKDWGGMVRELVRDVACPDRDDPHYPFLRNFDPYAGHTWASGHAKFADGNNNESSSEAMAAWTGVILWAAFTGDTALRDLGVYLFASELSAIEEYWFDVEDNNYPPAFTPATATMIWGGKAGYETWFSGKPEHKHGINFLPMHGGSLYLGRYPDYVKRNLDWAIEKKGGSRDWETWPSIMILFEALHDPEAAQKHWDAIAATAKLDSGNTVSNTLHWLGNLRKLGQLDREVTADYPLAAAFKGTNGKKRYTAYNGSGKEMTITFSDGTKITVAPGNFGVR